MNRLSVMVSLAALILLGQGFPPAPAQRGPGFPPATAQNGQGSPPASTAQKPGLDPSEMAALAYKVFKQDAVVVYADNISVTSIAEAGLDAETFSFQLRKQGLSTNRAIGTVIFQESIPLVRARSLALLMRKVVRGVAPKIVSIPDSALKDGTITFETKSGEVIDIFKLGELKTAKVLRPSSYFGTDGGTAFLCGVKVVNLPYLDFAKMIAKAVSGHVRTTSKEAFIEVDGQAFKQRIHKFLDAAYKLAPEAKVGQTPIPTMNEDGDEMMSYTVRTNSVPVFKPSIKLMDSVISGMANQEVESAFSFLGSSAKVSLTGRQDLQSSAVEYLRASAGVMPAQSSGGPVRRGGGANNSNPANSLINSVNPNSPGEFEVSSGMGLQLKLNLRNMRGRGNQPDRSYSLTILPN